MKYFIGIDIGTSSAKGMLLSKEGIIKTVSYDYPVFYPQNGWSEQNPSDWYNAAIRIISELTEYALDGEVYSISFSGQMHGLVVLDENDNVIRPAILWNDGRSAEQTEYLNSAVGRDFLLDNTGNIAFPGFTAPKLLWMYENERDNFDRIRKIMLPKDYVAYMLSGVFATDTSDAAGTLYFDTKNRSWSRSMLDLLRINENMLPKVFESNECIGYIKEELAYKIGLKNAKIIIGAGDNAASAIGTGAVNNGDCNISLGTSGTVFVLSDSFGCDRSNAIHSFCSANGKYHYLACILSAASCQKWWVEDILNAEYNFDAAEKYIGKSRVIFLPYLMGERSPINNTAIRGSFIGLCSDTTREEMTIAVLEGVSFALRQNVEIIRSLGVDISSARVCGGTRNRLWLRILADILKIDLQIPVLEHGGVLGAAMLAAQSELDEADYQRLEGSMYKIKEVISPNSETAKFYDSMYEKYLRLQHLLLN